MNNLAIAVIVALTPLISQAGDMAQIPMTRVDEPGVMSMMLVSMAIIGAIKLKNKFRK